MLFVRLINYLKIEIELNKNMLKDSENFWTEFFVHLLQRMFFKGSFKYIVKYIPRENNQQYNKTTIKKKKNFK